jgi:hypothetical protein
MSGLYLGLIHRQHGDHRYLHHPADEAHRLPPEKAGAVEVASSTNGQLTPPVMGAAAFLMAEYVGIPTPRSSSTPSCRR